MGIKPTSPSLNATTVECSIAANRNANGYVAGLKESATNVKRLICLTCLAYANGTTRLAYANGTTNR